MKPVSQIFSEGVLFLLSLSAAGQGLSPNLVQNGGFDELGPNLNMSPWHSGGGGAPNVFLFVQQPPTPDGGNFVQVTSFICQDLPTAVGQPYLFRFAFGGNDQVQVNSGPLHVTWGKQEVVMIPVTPVPMAYPQWRYFDFVVMGESNTTRIAFSTRGLQAFPCIDDVHVTAIPSTSMALPQSLTAQEESTAVFTFETITPNHTSRFQWLFNGTNVLPGATNAALRLTQIQPMQAGLYSVVVSNSALVATSAPARLTIVRPVKQQTVPVLMAGVLQNGTLLHFECADGSGGAWTPLKTMAQWSGEVVFVDASFSLPEQRMYRVCAESQYLPWLRIDRTTAICLSGSVGTRLQIDYLNAIGPPDAWRTIDTVTLTNSTQLYYNEALLWGKSRKVYRVVPMP